MTVTVTAKHVLQRARRLIADPQNWTQGTPARDSNGTPTEPKAANAVCFCALGAVSRASAEVYRANPKTELHLDRMVTEAEAKIALRKAGNRQGVHSFIVGTINDERGHEATLKMFDEAIASL